MKNIQYLLFIAGTIPFLVGCISPSFLQKIFVKNPDIVVESIKKNPVKYMEAFIIAQKAYVEQEKVKRKSQRLKKLQQDFDNPKVPVTKASRMYKGNKNAPITIVEYFDFQCGYCVKVLPVMKELLKIYPKDVRILLKHLPLFPGSADAAAYFEAVGMQNAKKATKFHDMVFAKKRSVQLNTKFLDKLAMKLKVNMKKLKKDLVKAKALIKEDRAEAEKFGFSGTPGFLVGGVVVPGALPLEHFKKLIDKHLDRMKNKK